MVDPIELGENALKKASEFGADEAEVFFQRDKTTELEIQRNDIQTLNYTSDFGMGIRVIIDKKLGFSYTNVLTEEKIESALKKAVSLAKNNIPDKDWLDLPHAKSYPKIENLYDKRIEEIDSSEIVDIAQHMLNTVTDYDKRLIFAFGGIGAGVREKLVMNTHGVRGYGKGTFIYAMVGLIARDGEKVTPVVSDFDFSKAFKLNYEKICQNTSKFAITALDTEKATSGKYDVIFEQSALESILRFTLFPAIKGDNVVNNRSPLKDKIDQQIFSENLTIYDDGLYPDAIGTEPFDDEGTPSQKVPIIEKGVLKGFLYDNYTAKKVGNLSTGNGLRAGSSTGASISYTLLPSIQPKNIVIKPGKYSPGDLIKEVKNGILVYDVQGAHSSNPSTGEFSVATAPAWKIENGEVTKAIKGALLSGTIYDIFKEDVIVGKNVRKRFKLISPWILTRNVSLAV